MIVDGFEELPKPDLLTAIRREWAAWEQAVAEAADRTDQPGVEGDWSVKDVIAHICAYERWLVGLLGGQVRRLPEAPAGVNMNDVHQRNAWLHSLDRERSVEDIRAEAQAVHEHLVAMVEARSEDDLRTVYTFGPNDDLVPASPGRGHRAPLATVALGRRCERGSLPGTYPGAASLARAEVREEIQCDRRAIPSIHGRAHLLYSKQLGVLGG